AEPAQRLPATDSHTFLPKVGLLRGSRAARGPAAGPGRTPAGGSKAPAYLELRSWCGLDGDDEVVEVRLAGADEPVVEGQSPPAGETAGDLELRGRRAAYAGEDLGGKLSTGVIRGPVVQRERAAGVWRHRGEAPVREEGIHRRLGDDEGVAVRFAVVGHEPRRLLVDPEGALHTAAGQRGARLHADLVRGLTRDPIAGDDECDGERGRITDIIGHRTGILRGAVLPVTEVPGPGYHGPGG